MTDGKKEIQKAIDALQHTENKESSGATPRLPKAQMLDATALEKKHPDKYFRYVTTRDPAKPQTRKADGFKRVDAKEAEEAGVNDQVGTMILMEQPRGKHDERIAKQEARNKELLEAHNQEVEKVAEAIVRELRDKYSLDVPLNRLLVKEQ